MVSRIEVIPSEVRGYGNIVEAKSVEDFVPVESDLVYSENVYSLTALEGLRITLTASQSSISYGSSVSLSATVVEDDTPVTGVSVTFYDGSTSLGSATTNSNGVATYTTSSLTVGSHSCTAVYDEKTSNSVSVTVNKLASTISLTVPASGTVGTAYTVTGTLVPSTGSVKLYENGSLKDTLTVSSGSFSKSVTQNSEGTYSYYAVFEGSSTYEGSTSSIQSITVEAIPVPSYNGVSLSSNKSILSKYNSESATLTAQLLDGSTPASVSGVTVEFFNGSTSLGTATTNSSGVATKSYTSAGIGDMTLTAEVDSYSSEEVSLVDADYYNPTGVSFTSSSSTDRKEQSGITYTYSTPSKFEVSYDYTITSGQNLRWYFITNPTSSSNQYGIGFQKFANQNNGVVTVRTTSSSNVDKVGSISIGQTVNIRIIRDNSTFQVYVGETLATTKTITWWDSHKPYGFAWGIWGVGAAKIENIIVKPL